MPGNLPYSAREVLKEWNYILYAAFLVYVLSNHNIVTVQAPCILYHNIVLRQRYFKILVLFSHEHRLSVAVQHRPISQRPTGLDL